MSAPTRISRSALITAISGSILILAVIASQTAILIWGPETLNRFSNVAIAAGLGIVFAVAVGACLWNSFQEELEELIYHMMMEKAVGAVFRGIGSLIRWLSRQPKRRVDEA